ncbi:MAG: hypothetical protein IT379_27005 [Deltaproteobacteria bacterium]|nr:hypothetical protein [Deltaproteobacteria bacterium]
MIRRRTAEARGRVLRDAIGGYGRALVRRAGLVVGLRALLGAMGVGVIGVVSGALLVGPLAPAWVVVIAWTTVAAAIVATAGWLARPLADLVREGPAWLLRSRDAELAGRLRSALELRAAPPSFSSSLVHAHAAHVGRALGRHPASAVLPWSRTRPGLALVGLAVALVLAGYALEHERLLAGLVALTSPLEQDESGDRAARVLGDVSAELHYPAYMRREPTRVAPGRGDVTAPRGTSVRVTAKLLVPVRSAVIEIRAASGPRRAPSRIAAAVQGDQLSARFVVEGDARWVARLETSEASWTVDREERFVRLEPDRAPTVRIVAPRNDAVMEADDEAIAMADVEDDWGIRKVELVVSTEGAEPRRRRVSSSDALDAPERSLTVETTISPAQLGIQPGERATIWFEATDVDDVAGPRVGRSARRVISVASEVDRHAESLAELAGALDATVHLLADRLERPVLPDADARGARARFEHLRERTEALLGVLGTLEPRFASDPRARRSMAGVVATLRNRMAQQLGREWRLHDPELAPIARRSALDAEAVGELESASLTLEDLLGRARLDDARLIARELAAIRARMAELLDQLERTGSPEVRARLLAELSRLERRMRELSQRLATLGHDVPSDFLNAQSTSPAETNDRLRELRDAIERGDLAAARRALLGLAGAVGRIDASLTAGSEAFEADRFGPEQRALAELVGDLEELGVTQGDLGRRAGAVRRRMAEQAGAGASPASRAAAAELSQRARETARALGTTRRGVNDSLSGDALDRAVQRTDDVAAALAGLDLDEARRMADAAEEDLEHFESFAFPPSGFGGPRATRAARETSQRARQSLRQLRRRIDSLVPRGSAAAEGRDLDELRTAAEPQRRTAAGAARIRERLTEGPSGVPISLEGAETMRRAEDAMRTAADALDRGDPRRAGEAQDRAARAIEDTLRSLQQQGPSEQGSQSGSDGRTGGRERVEIPEGSVDEATRDLRRRVQDAMRDAPPERFRDSVRRYWREIAR